MVSRQMAGGRPRTLVPWPLSGAGRHLVEAQGESGSWRSSVEVLSETISKTAFAVLLEDLSYRLPASIALSLDRCSARLPIRPVELDQATLAEELRRLLHTVEGWPDGIVGLAEILRSISSEPLVRLAVEREIRPVSRSLRPDLTRLGPILASVPLDRRGRPRRIVDLRPVETYDTPENRFIAHFTRLVVRRLRRLLRLADERHSDVERGAVRGLEDNLRRAAARLVIFDDLQPLAIPPVSQAMLRLAPYRRGLRLWRRFSRALACTVDDRRLDAPSRNLPDLYELWGTLSVIAGAVEALNEAGWTVERQEILGETSYGFGVRILPSNQTALVARSPGGGRRLHLVPKAAIGVGGEQLSGLSHAMYPDVAVLVLNGRTVMCALLFDPKYKRSGSQPKTVDIDKMHAYRDAIRDCRGRRVVTYAGIIYPGPSQDFSGQVGAISGVPGNTSPKAEVREKILAAIHPNVSARVVPT